MKILFCTHVFAPSLGGLEAVSQMLAQAFTEAGHEVRLVTQTPAADAVEAYDYEVIRRPSMRRLWRLTREADLVFHNNLSLMTAWPLLVVRRPWVVAHHIWIPRAGILRAVKGWLKRSVLRRATAISVSEAIAADFSSPSVVIPNPYDAEMFRPIDGVRRDQALVFVGRFVEDKGLPVLLRALRALCDQGHAPKLTVVGSGPEDDNWKKLTRELNLADRVEFVGVKRGRELAGLLNAHRVMVIPSLWDEPFGVVALEGIACGCVVVGSEGGGLKDAIGAAGITFRNGDVDELAARLKAALNDERLVARCRAAAPGHLTRHEPATVAGRYLEVFTRALSERQPCP